MHSRLTYTLAAARIHGDGMMGGTAAGAPAELLDLFSLPGGTTLVLRAVERTDRERIHELFHRLSEESRYRRFLTPKPELSERELAYLSEIDHVSHEAIAAVEPRDGSFAGLVRVVRRRDCPEAADVAIEVTDELQHMGIGSRLMTRIVERAREMGFASLTATALSENAPARALLKRSGFRAYARAGPEIELERELRSTGEAIAA